MVRHVRNTILDPESVKHDFIASENYQASFCAFEASLQTVQHAGTYGATEPTEHQKHENTRANFIFNVITYGAARRLVGIKPKKMSQVSQKQKKF